MLFAGQFYAYSDVDNEYGRSLDALVKTVIKQSFLGFRT